MEALYTGQHPNVTGFLGATFYPPRSSILIACEFMDLRSFKDVMAVMQASTKGVSCLPPPSPIAESPFPSRVCLFYIGCVCMWVCACVSMCVWSCVLLLVYV